MTARPALPEKPLLHGGEDPSAMRILLERQRRILFGLAVAIMSLGIIAIAQSFHGSVFARNGDPEVRKVVAAEPARSPTSARPGEPALDGLLFQPSSLAPAALPASEFRKESKPAPPEPPKPRIVSRSANCDGPMPKNAWLDICG